MKNGPYILVRAPEDYPGKKYRGLYVYEHHLVWWKHTGQTLGQDFVIHHKNHRKTDNRFKNLEMMSKSVHTKDHTVSRGKAFKKFICTNCSSEFLRPVRSVNKKSVNLYCSKKCGGTARSRVG